LHVLAVALFDRAAFKTCLAHGIVLGDDGQKMSKRLRNYPDPEAMFETHGADAMRWFLMSSPVIRGGDLIADEKGITDAVRRTLLPLWNSWYFFSLYANAADRKAAIGRVDPPLTLDRYVLAKSRQLVEGVTAALDDYDLSGACLQVEQFLDVLTNWYIRRSRDRFWDTGSGSGSRPERPSERGSQDAFDTLGTVLEVLCRTAAPLLPMIAEEVWQGLTSAPPTESVHLADWPDPSVLPSDPGLVAAMDRVREICSAAHSIRKANNRRARLPLASLTAAVPAAEAEALRPFADLIKDEVNVREVVFSTEFEQFAIRTLAVNFKVAAPRLGPATQAAAAAAKRGDWEVFDGDRARVGESVLEAGEWELRVQPVDEATTRTLAGDAGLVVLDLDVTEDLAVEGRARDLVRRIQQHRRELNLAVTDRIHLEVAGGPDLRAALDAHRAWIAEQVLAVSVAFVETGAGDGWVSAILADGTDVAIRVRRAAEG
jgi:isoleucyl-tRNA synthetase